MLCALFWGRRQHPQGSGLRAWDGEAVLEPHLDRRRSPRLHSASPAGGGGASAGFRARPFLSSSCTICVSAASPPQQNCHVSGTGRKCVTIV